MAAVPVPRHSPAPVGAAVVPSIRYAHCTGSYVGYITPLPIKKRAMSKWGVFLRGDTDDERHVLPVSDDGEPVGGHKAIDCWCRPRRDPEDTAVVIHNDRERGGSDA